MRVNEGSRREAKGESERVRRERRKKEKKERWKGRRESEGRRAEGKQRETQGNEKSSAGTSTFFVHVFRAIFRALDFLAFSACLAGNAATRLSPDDEGVFENPQPMAERGLLFKSDFGLDFVKDLHNKP